MKNTEDCVFEDLRKNQFTLKYFVRARRRSDRMNLIERIIKWFTFDLTSEEAALQEYRDTLSVPTCEAIQDSHPQKPLRNGKPQRYDVIERARKIRRTSHQQRGLEI